ncbi:hypothetical protein STENM223S_09505 [Streptomyces tendae]
MPRFSRSENKRRKDQAGPEQAPASGLKPIEVHVTVDGRATVGGLPVAAGSGEQFQSAVLNYLHRLVLATGHPVAATVNDERIGYLTPVRVEADGSSAFAGEPVPPLPRDVMAAAQAVAEEHASVRAQAVGGAPAAAVPDEHPVAREQPSTMPLTAVPASARPVRDKSTRALRAVPDPAPGEPLAAERTSGTDPGARAGRAAGDEAGPVARGAGASPGRGAGRSPGRGAGRCQVRGAGRGTAAWAHGAGGTGTGGTGTDGRQDPVPAGGARAPHQRGRAHGPDRVGRHHGGADHRLRGAAAGRRAPRGAPAARTRGLHRLPGGRRPPFLRALHGTGPGPPWPRRPGGLRQRAERGGRLAGAADPHWGWPSDTN